MLQSFRFFRFSDCISSAVHWCAFAVAAGWAIALPALAQDLNSVEPQAPSIVDDARVSRDLETIAKNKGVATVWSFSDRSKSTLQTPPVPLFMPPEIVDDLTKRADKTASPDRPEEDDNGRIITLKDEYYAVRQFARYRLTVQGTRQKFAFKGDSDAAKSAAGPSPDYYSGFTTSETGGTVTFGYAGADYLVDFECSETPDCVQAVEAERVVEQLVLCSVEGRCVDNGIGLITR